MSGKEVAPKELDARQMKAVLLEVQGKSRKEIADACEVSEKTISTWRNHLPLYQEELIKHHEDRVGVQNAMLLDSHVRTAQLTKPALRVLESVMNETDDEGKPTGRALQVARFLVDKAIKFNVQENDLNPVGNQVNAGVLMVFQGGQKPDDVPDGTVVIDLNEGSVTDG